MVFFFKEFFGRESIEMNFSEGFSYRIEGSFIEKEVSGVRLFFKIYRKMVRE